MADGRVLIEAILDTTDVSKNVKGMDKQLDSVSWKNIKEGDARAQALSSSFKNAGTACTLSFTAPIVAAGGAFAAMSMDFDNAMAKVSTIADTSEVPLDDLRTAILDLSDDTGIAASDIADNVYNAISAGQSTGDAVNFVANAAKLATAGFTDSASALDLLSTTMNAYGMEADQVNRVSDVLLMTQNKGKTTVGELSAQMGKVIPTASAYGVSLENLAAAYATTTAKGIATAESTTYISGMLNELGDSGSEVGKIVKDKLGKSFKECMDSGMSLGEVLASCKEYADENGVSLNELFGSAEAGKAALAIAGDGIEGFTSNLDAMNNSSGATDEAFGKMQTDSWNLQKAMNEINNVMIDLGGTIVDTLRPAIEGFVGGVSEFSDWFKSIGTEGQQVILAIAAIVAAIGPLLVIVGTLAGAVGNISALFAGFGTAAAGAGAAAGGVGASLGALLGPVALVVAAVAAIAAVFVYLWNTSDAFRDAVAGAWNTIMSAVQGVIEQLRPYVEQAWAAIQNAVSTCMSVIVPLVSGAFQYIIAVVVPILESILNTVGNVFAAILATVSGVMDGVSAVISGVWNVISGIVKTVVGAIHGFVTGDFSMMRDGVGSIMDGMLGIITGIWNTISSVIGGIINTIGSVITGGVDAARASVEGAFNGMKSIVDNVMGGAKNVVSDALDSIAGFFRGLHIEWPHIPVPHFSISGSFNLDPFNFSVPSIGINWYAKGGVFNGPSVIGVGEAGPEAAVPLSGARMRPFAEEIAKQMPNGSGGVTVEVKIENFNNYTQEDLDALVERVMRDIQRKLKMQERAKGYA